MKNLSKSYPAIRKTEMKALRENISSQDFKLIFCLIPNQTITTFLMNLKRLNQLVCSISSLQPRINNSHEHDSG